MLELEELKRLQRVLEQHLAIAQKQTDLLAELVRENGQLAQRVAALEKRVATLEAKAAEPSLAQQIFDATGRGV